MPSGAVYSPWRNGSPGEKKTKLLRGKSLHLPVRLAKLPKYEGLTRRRPVDVLDCRRGAQWFPLTFDSKSSQAGEPLMKITNWCKKLSAALIAGGLIVPTAATAAD